MGNRTPAMVAFVAPSGFSEEDFQNGIRDDARTRRWAGRGTQRRRIAQDGPGYFDHQVFHPRPPRPSARLLERLGRKTCVPRAARNVGTAGWEDGQAGEWPPRSF